MLLAHSIDNGALVLAGRALPGRMSSQQGEDEGRTGHDAEFAECHAEASPCHHHISLSHTHTHTFKDMLAVHFLHVNLNLRSLLFGMDNAFSMQIF